MADTRVTQAGRNVALQQDADVRVTQAGRNVALQQDADVRVTQAGRNVALQVTDGALRVTQLGRQVLLPKPTPSVPFLINPEDGETYTLTINIVYTESVDPIGGTTTHTFEYKKSTDSVWTTLFTGRAGDDVYVWDISGLDDVNYDVRIYATNVGGTGEDSATSTATITVDNTSPGPPRITAPFSGQEWIPQNPQRVEWEAADDPNDLPLTYKIDYRAVGAGSWTSVTTGLTTLYYDWDVSAFPADDYEVRVYANNGSVDGTPDVVQFEITTADRPATPTIRITSISENCVSVELSEYQHPTPRDWASTTYVVYPYNGSNANPLATVTTTDPDEQSEIEICGLPSGAYLVVEAYYTDNAANDSLTTPPTEFTLADLSRIWVKRWDTEAIWGSGGPGVLQGLNGPDGDQDPASAVLRDALRLGSCYVRGFVLVSGCNCGWLGRDTELRDLGIGIFDGYASDGTWEGIRAYLDTGIVTSGTDINDPRVGADLCMEVRWPDGSRDIECVDLGKAMQHLVSGFTNVTGAPIGSWAAANDRVPWYEIEMLVQRDISPAAPTTRIRAKIHPAIGFNVANYDQSFFLGVPEEEWHIDVTYNKLGPCGKPGFNLAQGGLGLQTSRSYFRDLDYRALRDNGLENATTLPQPLFEGPAALGDCIPEAETALPTPIFFPIPPNGDVTEGVVYPTDVIGTWDDSEQRINLRERPRLRVGWTGTVLTSEEHTDFMAVLYEEQPSRWIVPLWQDAAPLLVDLASSSSSIPAASVDTEDRRFESMTHVALWVDQFTYHVTEAVLENDGSITLTDQTTQNFVANATYVLPCRIGQFPQRIQSRRMAPFIAETAFEFILEGVATDG